MGYVYSHIPEYHFLSIIRGQKVCIIVLAFCIVGYVFLTGFKSEDCGSFE